MNLSKRTKLTLSQLISLFDSNNLRILLDKYNITTRSNVIDQIILKTDNETISNIFEEIVRRMDDFRYSTLYAECIFDSRLDELKLCLLLDGFKIENNIITRIEPTIDGNSPIEDDLTKELEQSTLSDSKEIISHINRSAQSFLKQNPDYNGCLSNARIALETLIRNIAKSKGFISTDDNKAWGQALNYLKTNGFLTQKEEQTIGSVYTFVSNGSHIPLGFTEEEYTRFGRNLVTSICYFISKLFTGNNA
jgi:hypothetical protein